MENEDNDLDKVKESQASYHTSRIKIFKSFKEQEEYEFQQMINLTPTQRLEQLRKCINIAYGMHGHDPTKLPTKHSIKIILPKDQ